MFIATNRIKTVKGRGGELEARFAQRRGVEQRDGFLGFEMWRLNGSRDHDEYLIVTHWETKAAHEAWTKSESFREAHSGPRADFLIGHGEFHSYDVVLSSTPHAAKTPV